MILNRFLESFGNTVYLYTSRLFLLYGTFVSLGFSFYLGFGSNLYPTQPLYDRNVGGCAANVFKFILAMIKKRTRPQPRVREASTEAEDPVPEDEEEANLSYGQSDSAETD